MRSLICLLLLLPAVALAQDAAAPLARNAWYWQARARSDKAEDAWKNVLKVAPDDPEALAALGGFAARGGRSEEARAFLERLLKANPKHPEVPVLRRQVELGPRFHCSAPTSGAIPPTRRSLAVWSAPGMPPR